MDSLLHLVEDMSGRLKRLGELQPLASGPGLPAKPAAAELVERVKTLRSAIDKPIGGPAEAPYAPPRVDPGALPFVPMFSESTMLGEHTAPARSMREGHVTTDPRSLTVQMSHAAQDLPTTTTAHAVYAEEEIQSQTMQGRTMGSADGHGRGHQGGNLWANDPNTGIWTAARASPSRIPNPMGSTPTGPHSMEERDVRGVYSEPPGHRWYPSRWSGGCGCLADLIPELLLHLLRQPVWECPTYPLVPWRSPRLADDLLGEVLPIQDEVIQVGGVAIVVGDFHSPEVVNPDGIPRD